MLTTDNYKTNQKLVEMFEPNNVTTNGKHEGVRAVHEPPFRRAQWRDTADDVTPRRARRALQAQFAVGRLGVVGEH